MSSALPDAGAPAPPPGVRTGPLPVGVVIPCRNSAAYVARQLEGLAPWIDLAEEIVVVDSESTDGTVELLRQGLRHPRLRFLNHPPGLYPSWNFGIGQLAATYTYVATMGDTITRPGLLHLLEVAEQFQSDVVISPPRFVAGPGRHPPDRVWPIHRLIGWLEARRPRALAGAQAFLTTALLAPSGILGSSASNLYRTEFLQRHPFPAQYGHCSDTAWTLVHGLEARWALTPEVISEFLVHPNAGPTGDPDHALAKSLLDLALETCRAHGPGGLLADLLEWQRQTTALWASQARLRELRRVGARWVLDPKAWRARSEAHGLRARVAGLQQALYAGLRGDRYGTGTAATS